MHLNNVKETRLGYLPPGCSKVWFGNELPYLEVRFFPHRPEIKTKRGKVTHMEKPAHCEIITGPGITSAYSPDFKQLRDWAHRLMEAAVILEQEQQRL